MWIYDLDKKHEMSNRCSPHYYFYENCKGFQFRCLDGLYRKPTNGTFVADSEGIAEDGNNVFWGRNKVVDSKVTC